MEQTTFVLHKIRVFNGYLFDADTEILFDSSNYSMFKYGAGTVAKQYGYSLCARFIEQYKGWFIQDNKSESEESIYITCAPFKVAPTASHAVASYFTEALNMYLLSRSLPSAILFQIERSNVFEGDYAQLPALDRREVMSRNSLVLHHTIDLKNKHVILIDDIRITGSHEERVMNLITKHQPKSVCKMYVALFEQQKGLEKPQHEAALNNALVKTLADLDNLIKGMGDKYIPNARVCKFLLSQQDTTALRQFLGQQSYYVLKRILDYMQGDEYHSMQSYKRQYKIVKQVVQAKQKKSSQRLVGLGLSMIGGAGIFCSIKSKS